LSSASAIHHEEVGSGAVMLLQASTHGFTASFGVSVRLGAPAEMLPKASSGSIWAPQRRAQASRRSSLNGVAIASGRRLIALSPGPRRPGDRVQLAQPASTTSSIPSCGAVWSVVRLRRAVVRRIHLLHLFVCRYVGAWIQQLRGNTVYVVGGPADAGREAAVDFTSIDHVTQQVKLSR
jgi:hypothetical protein